MERYKYIIIDDEYPSHLTIHHHLKAHENYTRVANFFLTSTMRHPKNFSKNFGQIIFQSLCAF